MWPNWKYIACDLDTWSKNPVNNFKLNNLVIGATNIVENSDKEEWVYSGYRIAFEGAGSWSFDNDFDRNVIIFGVDNISSSYSDNRKNHI